jgi:pimeloyl-ACP methyl ester carboxylesterase
MNAMKNARLLTARAVLAAVITFLAFARVRAADVDAAEQPSRIGTLTMQRHGDHGTPVILIPGLASGGWVWDDLVGRLKDDHVLYVVTLAGFDGIAPPAQGKLMDLADDSLAELIRTQKLDRPVLVGHSLGGTLSIRFAERHSELIGGVVAVDGLPIFPGFERMSAEQRAAMAENIRARMAGGTPEQFAAQQLQYMKTIGVLDEKRAAELAKRMARSDPAATAQYMAEDLGLDLRPDLPRITVPVLELCPYNAADVAKTRPMTQADKVAYYRELLKGAPHVEVVSIAPARHFAMVDQPEKFANAVTGFLASIARDATTAPATGPAR